MEDDEELNLTYANVVLGILDQAESSFPDGLLKEMSKAVTVAQEASNVEARVVCKTPEEALAVRICLFRKASLLGGKFDLDAGSLEFPNGSAVVAVWRT